MISIEKLNSHDQDMSFRRQLEELLPKYILFNDKRYIRGGYMLYVKNSFRIYYSLYEEEGDELFDYIDTFDNVFNKAKKYLSTIKYKKLEEIPSTEESFRRELISLLNKYSKENISNTPDFILADYLIGCIRNFNHNINRREQWYLRS